MTDQSSGYAATVARVSGRLSLRRLLRSDSGRDGLLTIVLLLTSTVPLLLSPVRARALGPSGRGAFAYCQSSLMIVASSAMLGFRYAAYSLRADRVTMSGLRQPAMVSTAISLGLGVPLSIFGARRFGFLIAVPILFAAVAGAAYSHLQFELASAQQRRDRRWITVVLGGPPTIDFVVNIAAALLGSLRLGVVVLSTAAVELFRVGSAVVFRRTPSRRSPPREDYGDGQQLVRSGVRLAPAVLMPIVANNMDVLIFAAFTNARTLGVYSVARIGSNLFIPVSSALEGRVLGASRIGGFGAGVKASMIPVFGLFALLAPVGYLAMGPVFGSSFSGAAPAFVVGLGGGAFAAIGAGILAMFAADGRSRDLLVSPLILVIATGSACVLAGALDVRSVTVLMCASSGAPVLALAYLFLAAKRHVRDSSDEDLVPGPDLGDLH